VTVGRSITSSSLTSMTILRQQLVRGRLLPNTARPAVAIARGPAGAYAVAPSNDDSRQYITHQRDELNDRAKRKELRHGQHPD
jgi:hypothetical protein